MKHRSSSLPGYKKLTTGVPAILRQPTGAMIAARRLAKLIGCNRGILGASTLHLFLDVFTTLAKDGITVFVDAGTYPIARWVLKSIAGRGVSVKVFKHHDPGELKILLRRNGRSGRRAVVLSDGFCPGCGSSAPIREYMESIRQVGGLLIIDDTQALGVFGEKPSSLNPFGVGGGGSLRRGEVKGSDIVVINSMAKAFGAPVAILAGGNGFVKRFEADSRTRLHCSPPSNVAIQAVLHALEVNEKSGDELRKCLLQRVTRFRRKLRKEGLEATGNMFPVQGVSPIPGLDVYEVYERLQEQKIKTVLRRSHLGQDPQIAMILTTEHTPSQIDDVVAALSRTVRRVWRC